MLPTLLELIVFTHDRAKPQIGISSVWWEGNPCNQHLLGLAQKVKEGCELEGLIGFMHSTVGVSDGMTQGNLGMKYSLPSRDLIADSIEVSLRLFGSTCRPELALTFSLDGAM